MASAVRGASRKKVHAHAYRCEWHGHPLRGTADCETCGSPSLVWTNEIERDFKRVAWWADEIKRGGRPVDQIAEHYDHERWPDTTPGDLAYASTLFLRWGKGETREPNGRRIVRPSKPEVADDGRHYIDCACGERCFGAYFENDPEGASMAMWMHLHRVSMSASGGARSTQDVPGHTLQRDAQCATPAGRQRFIEADAWARAKHPDIYLPPLEFEDA